MPALTEEDIALLKGKDALTVPPQAVRDALLQSYVDNIHPITPIADVISLQRVLGSGGLDNEGSCGYQSIGFALFQTIMYTGAICVAKRHLVAAGYTSRETACRTLFSRAKLWHELEYRQIDNTYSVIRSLILISYWYHPAHDEVKDNRHWLSVAVALAYKAQLHRDPALFSLSADVRKLRKRIWWALFIADQTLAIGSSLPCLIQQSDFDVSMPSAEDFIYGQGTEPRGQDYYLLYLGWIITASRQRKIASCFIDMCQLSMYINRCLSATSIVGAICTVKKSLQCQELLQNLKIWRRALRATKQDAWHGTHDANETRMSRTHRVLIDLMYYSCLSVASKGPSEQINMPKPFEDNRMSNAASLLASKSMIRMAGDLDKCQLPYIFKHLFQSLILLLQ